MREAAVVTSTTFDTPGEHSYVVPVGVTRLTVRAVGGTGGDSPAGGFEVRPAAGGPGANVDTVIAVTPGQTLYAEVGSNADGPQPGANGGGPVGPYGAGQPCSVPAGAGGGASDVRTLPIADPGTLGSRIVVAGGGGGAAGSGSSGIGGDGGQRGEAGVNGSVGISPPNIGPIPGGYAGYDGVARAGTGPQFGTAASGGAGQVAPARADGCGGGGGGGFGGGEGGGVETLAQGTDAGGGGGGGGGSLTSDGPVALGLPAPAGTTPSVTFDAAPPNAGTLHVTSSAFTMEQGETTNCPSSCASCNESNLGVPANVYCPESPDVLAPGHLFDAGWLSQLNWGAAALKETYRRQEGVGVNPAPLGEPIELGKPFELADFVHWNDAIRGDSPTALALWGFVTVQPPGGDPVHLQLGDPSLSNHEIGLGFVETYNETSVSACDPSIQQSNVPCDDLFTLGGPDLAARTIGGVTWHITLLGWDDLKGGYTRRLSTIEGIANERKIYAELTVDTNPTSTSVTADGQQLTAQVTPTPSTGGTMSFSDGGATIAGCDAVPVDTTTGTAGCADPALAHGSHSIVATYSGGVGFAASASTPLSVTVADTTPPTTTLVLDPSSPTGSSGWYRGAVSVAVTALDDPGGSGVAATRCVVDPATAPQSYDDLPATTCPTSIELTTDGIHTVYAASIDQAGNKESPVSIVAKIDSTAPALNPTIPQPLTLDQGGASAAPNATDASSGVASSSCDALDTSTVGDHIVTCTASDVAGNTSTVSIHYLVGYGIAFVRPRAGSTLVRGTVRQVAFALTDAAGKPIPTGQATALANACRVTFSATGAQTAGPICVRYDRVTRRFEYLWNLPLRGDGGLATISATITYPDTRALTTSSINVNVRPFSWWPIFLE